MTQHAQFPQVYPAIQRLPPFQGQLADGNVVFSRVIDITDPVSDPANPIPDFGENVNLTYTRCWRLSWSVRLDLLELAWAGTNRSDLTLEVQNDVNGVSKVENSRDLVRLFIPAQAARYVYTGSRVVHSREAVILIRNNTGAAVFLEVDWWAKAW